MLQIFYPPSRPSFIYHAAVHKPGDERPSDRKFVERNVVFPRDYKCECLINWFHNKAPSTCSGVTDITCVFQVVVLGFLLFLVCVA